MRLSHCHVHGIFLLLVTFQSAPRVAEASFSDTPTSINITTTDGEEQQGIRNGDVSPPLEYYGVFQNRVVCGASLIAADVALTAAHCVQKRGFPGALRFDSTTRKSGGVVVNVTGGDFHPNWIPGKAASADLALLYLERPVDDDDALQPLVVNRDADVPRTDGSLLEAAGFGLINNTGGLSSELLATTFPFVQDCSPYMPNLYKGEKHVCANVTLTATCSGGT